jgi:hypothetical protein
MSKPNGLLTKFQSSRLVQQAATVAAPTVVKSAPPLQLPATTLTTSTKMIRLAEDGALHPDGRLRAAQLYILNVADFKGVPAG